MKVHEVSDNLLIRLLVLRTTPCFSIRCLTASRQQNPSVPMVLTCCVAQEHPLVVRCSFSSDPPSWTPPMHQRCIPKPLGHWNHTPSLYPLWPLITGSTECVPGLIMVELLH